MSLPSSPRVLALWPVGAVVGAVLFSRPLKTTVSLAVGLTLGQLIFVAVMRRIYRN